MRLEPVYLVAPTRAPATVPTRRAFLIAAGTFVAGAGLGGACGFAAGRGSRADAPAEPALQPTGDPTLDELRRLAVEAPIEELTGQWLVFLQLLNDTYPRDRALWRGARRIADEVLRAPDLPSRRAMSRWLAQVIQKGHPDYTHELLALVPQLLQVR